MVRQEVEKRTGRKKGNLIIFECSESKGHIFSAGVNFFLV